MKYVSLDLETTSLIPRPENILMLSMVVEDTDVRAPLDQLEHFTCFLNQPVITGQSYALGLNGWILDYISGRKKDPPYDVLTPENCFAEVEAWLRRRFPEGRITVAGKNVAGFDMQFLPVNLKSLFRHRVLDPGPMYFNPEADSQVPDLTECKRRAGLADTVAHDAREDALDVIRVIRAWSK